MSNDFSGHILEVNEALCQMLGYTREELLCLNISDIEASESVEETAIHIQKIIQTGSDRFQSRHRCKNGVIIDIEVSAQYVAKLGEFFFAFFRDITERKRAVELLRDSEARYKTLVQNIPQKIFLKDMNFRWVSINENFARDLGIRPEEAIGKIDSDFFPPELAAKYHADDVRIIQTGKTEEIEERYVQNGQDFWVNTIKTPLRDEQGLIGGVFGIFWDISDRKRAEEQVRQLNADLEQRVIQRTYELQAANADLEAFSYSVSHDLRAPLRAIDGFSAILREEYADKLDAEGQRLFRIVGDNAKKMGQLIDDILAFSRAGRIELQLIELDMNAMANLAWQEMKVQRAGRSIEFRLADLPVVRGDPAAIRQVLQNILSNAVKFTAGCVPAIIEVSGRREMNEIIYSVKDNGVGFDMQYAAKLFGLFQRLHGMEEFEGTGVGLSIVKRFVTKHGGRVWAEGRVGEGATFFFSLPT